MDEYTIEELASLTGFDRRVIRSFIEQGLMRGPDSLGRYARYTRAHLQRLLAIKELKEKRAMQLSEIRQALMVMSEDELRALAGEPVLVQTPSSAVASSYSDGPETVSALEYIRSIAYKIDQPPSPASSQMLAVHGLPIPNMIKERSEVQEVVPSQQVSQQKVPAFVVSAGPTPIEQLLSELEKIVDPSRTRKQAKSESWHRIAITPDIELSVRGINSSEQLTRLERIADCMREILMGGT